MQFLYFDLGNVLLSFCHDKMCRQMADVAGVDESAVRVLLMGTGPEDAPRSIQWRFERGLIDTDAAYEAFCEGIGRRPDRSTIFRAASDIFSPIHETVALVERLAAAGNRLGVLSNTNPLDWQFVTLRYAFLQRHFETAVLSFEAQAMKPEKAIFEAAIERAGAPPNEIFFVDDRPEHVAGARAAGLDAVQFTTAAALEHELARREVPGAVAR